MSEPDRILTGHFFGELDGVEVIFPMTVIHIDGRSVWCVRGEALLAVIGAGYIACQLFLDAAGGLPVEPQHSIEGAFERIYTVLR